MTYLIKTSSGQVLSISENGNGKLDVREADDSLLELILTED